MAIASPWTYFGLVVIAKTGFVLHEPLGDVISAAAQWLALGIVNLQPDVNGYPATHVLARVTWTISYEWAFYASQHSRCVPRPTIGSSECSVRAC